MIKIILVTVSLLIITWFLTNRNTSKARAGVKLGILLFFILALFVIAFPELANSAANIVGVGRGADLMLYVLTASFIFLVLSLYIRSKEEQQKFVKLARAVAILEADSLKTNMKLKREADRKYK